MIAMSNNCRFIQTFLRKLCFEIEKVVARYLEMTVRFGRHP